MSQHYAPPIVELLTVCSEAEIMVCSVRTSVNVIVEEYHDASFEDGNSQWTIGFDEPGSGLE